MKPPLATRLRDRSMALLALTNAAARLLGCEKPKRKPGKTTTKQSPLNQEAPDALH